MFKGEFQVRTAAGKPYIYSPKDIVFYQGKMYECVLATNQSPLQNGQAWKFTGSTVNTVTDNPPLDPYHGQQWTSTNGKTYVWITDSDGSQWVET